MAFLQSGMEMALALCSIKGQLCLFCSLLLAYRFPEMCGCWTYRRAHTWSPFAKALFKDLLQLDNVSSTYIVESAYHVPLGVNPVVRLLICGDVTSSYLQHLRNHCFNFESKILMLLPNFPAEIQRCQRTFLEEEGKKGTVCSVIYPSKLRVVYKGSTAFFDTSEDAK